MAASLDRSIASPRLLWRSVKTLCQAIELHEKSIYRSPICIPLCRQDN
jgi:hypothetical protein